MWISLSFSVSDQYICDWKFNSQELSSIFNSNKKFSSPEHTTFHQRQNSRNGSSVASLWILEKRKSQRTLFTISIIIPWFQETSILEIAVVINPPAITITSCSLAALLDGLETNYSRSFDALPLMSITTVASHIRLLPLYTVSSLCPLVIIIIVFIDKYLFFFSGCQNTFAFYRIQG